ncbi:MAG: hypothetical protein EBT97_11385 [Actinobacteria bacterium]|nr:hypothetical protein [Actinomycetota bacterium]
MSTFAASTMSGFIICHFGGRPSESRAWALTWSGDQNTTSHRSAFNASHVNRNSPYIPSENKLLKTGNSKPILSGLTSRTSARRSSRIPVYRSMNRVLAAERNRPRAGHRAKPDASVSWTAQP